MLMLGMHLAGALGRAVLPHLTVPDQVIPTLMVQVLPPWAAGLFLAAPMAAIMSNVNAPVAGFRYDHQRSVAQRASG
jgi:sodium/pantothenate symporter